MVFVGPALVPVGHEVADEVAHCLQVDQIEHLLVVPGGERADVGAPYRAHLLLLVLVVLVDCFVKVRNAPFLGLSLSSPVVIFLQLLVLDVRSEQVQLVQAHAQGLLQHACHIISFHQ